MQSIKKIKKIVFKEGEKIKVVNPLVFVRCGYPWDKKYVKENIITKEQKEKICELLGGKYHCPDTIIGNDLDYLCSENYSDYEKILDALAYSILRKNKFGGSKRSIHTENRPDLLGKECIISKKRTVKTGIYRAASGGGYYNEDLDPAFLMDEKTHVILSVYTCEPGYSSIEFDIEEKNVEKLLIEEQSTSNFEMA